jgi:hypothetical protein
MWKVMNATCGRHHRRRAMVSVGVLVALGTDGL